MAFTVQIMPSALEELRSIKVFYRRQIRDAIDDQLASQPLVPTKNRKLMGKPETSFEFRASHLGITRWRLPGVLRC